MSLRRASTGLLVAVVVSSAIVAACRSRAVLRFPHQVHLAGLECGGPSQPNCLTCNTCHTPSEAKREAKLPASTQCEGCHAGETSMVAAVLSTAPHRPYGEIAFDHDRHLSMGPIGGQCTPCHSGVVQAGARSVPPMSQCFSCHEHQEQWNRGQCAPCHQRSDLDRVLPQTFLRHEGNFAKNHGQLSESDQRLCRACHTQSECNDCHDVSQQFSVERRKPASIERSFVHRGDFMVRHAIEAQSQPSACIRCHEPATCDACHTLRGVSGNVLSAVNPHPPGWVGTDTQSSSFHGREARRDIVSCAGCHEQGAATNCIRCHKVGAFGGNPHPDGWKSSRPESSEMCRYCHG